MVLDTTHNLAKVGKLHAQDWRATMDTNVFALDLNHLLIRNFRNKLDLLQLDSTWEAKGYFVIGFEPLSVTLDSEMDGYNKLDEPDKRRDLFIEATQKGKYIKYPKYAGDNDPVPELSDATDIVLE